MLGRAGRRGQGVEEVNKMAGPAFPRSNALLKKPLTARPRSQRCSAGIPPVHARETGHPLPCSAALTYRNDECQLSMINHAVGLGQVKRHPDIDAGGGLKPTALAVKGV